MKRVFRKESRFNFFLKREKEKRVRKGVTKKKREGGVVESTTKQEERGLGPQQQTGQQVAFVWWVVLVSSNGQKVDRFCLSLIRMRDAEHGKKQ